MRGAGHSRGSIERDDEFAFQPDCERFRLGIDELEAEALKLAPAARRTLRTLLESLVRKSQAYGSLTKDRLAGRSHPVATRADDVSNRLS